MLNSSRNLQYCVATLILSMLFPGLAAQALHRVPADFPTIQAAIDAASSGDTVLVSPGTYTETLNIAGKAVSLISEEGPDTTIIEGDLINSAVRFFSVPSPGGALHGFTVANGNPGVEIRAASPAILGNRITGNQGGALDGGGISCSGCSALIRGNVIEFNTAVAGGGISVVAFGSPRIVGNVIAENSASSGGGIQLNGAGSPAGTPMIAGNVFLENTTKGGRGGGIDITNHSDASIVNNLFLGNGAGFGGGIAWLVPSGMRGPLVVNNTFVDNDSDMGSAVFAEGFDGQTQLVNNVVVATAGQTAIYCRDFGDPSQPIFRFNNVFSPSGMAYGGICTDHTGVDGNLSADPAFVDAAARNYRLRPDSPSVDAGENQALDLPGEDFDGGPRVLDGDGDGAATVDQGFSELLPPPTIVSVAPSAAPPGARITVTGTGYLARDLELGFQRPGDEAPGAFLEASAGTTLRVTVPNLPPGPADLEVVTSAGAATLPGGPGGFTVSGPATADLSIRKTGGRPAGPGQPVTYNITVRNEGPGDVYSAVISDIFPPDLIRQNWTCTASGGASCGTVVEMEPNDDTGSAQDLERENWSTEFDPLIGDAGANTSTTIPHVSVRGSGDDSVDLYTFRVNRAGARGVFDIDFGTTGGSLDSFLQLSTTAGAVLAFNGDSPLSAGEGGSSGTSDSFLEWTFAAPDTYLIAVGREPVTGATPAPLPAGSDYRLQISIEDHPVGGVGDIVQTVDLPAGDFLTYTATGIIGPSPPDFFTNTATVSAAAGFADPDSGNDSATAYTVLVEPVPTLSQWGILILTLALLGGGLHLLSRRATAL